MSLFAVPALPWIVTLPVTEVAPMLAVPVVLIVEDPPRTEVPLIVPFVNIEPSTVLLVRVWLASAVTIVPDVG